MGCLDCAKKVLRFIGRQIDTGGDLTMSIVDAHNREWWCPPRSIADAHNREQERLRLFF
jgi:hypothetical protein